MTEESNSTAALEKDKPDGWLLVASILFFAFVVIPVFAVIGALSVRLTMWVLIALGLLP